MKNDKVYTHMNRSLKFITITAIGISLYVAVSMFVKIPIGIGHISLDLGYIVLAVYCYIMGPASGAIVGAAGCTLVSLLTSGWFPVGWLLGNALIGGWCGNTYRRHRDGRCQNCLYSVIAVFVGIAIIKTVVECLLYAIPIPVKFVKNIAAFAIDAPVMCVGVLFAPRIQKILGVIHKAR